MRERERERQRERETERERGREREIIDNVDVLYLLQEAEETGTLTKTYGPYREKFCLWGFRQRLRRACAAFF